MTDDTSLGAYFQDFEVAAGVIPGNAWYKTVSTERFQFNPSEPSRVFTDHFTDYYYYYFFV